MNLDSLQTRTPVAWLPAALISWYTPNGAAVALVTSWVAMIGGQNPRIKAAWHGGLDPLARFWLKGDFVLNIPHDDGLGRLRKLIYNGRLCLDVKSDLEYMTSPGTAVSAPLLLDCAVQIECAAGCLVESQFDTELSGEPIRIHREDIILDSCDVPDLCAIHPLSTTRHISP